MATIRLVGIEMRYPKARDAAIRRADLEIADGEFFVLLGPSGCGKSTLLKLIAGLEEPTAGRIYIGGALVNYSPPGQRNVAMVFQDYALYPHMTVRENITFPLKMRRVSKSAAREAVAGAARALELDDLLDRRIGALSGGQRQRVALARAIVRNPAAMLLDEPLSNLDAVLRVQTRDELLRLHRTLHATTVYVTHDQIEAMTMGHRIAVMNRGVVEQLGTPRAVYDYPANTFVATFIGTPQMNLLNGRVTRRAKRPVFENGNVTVDLAERFNDVSDECVRSSSALGVRPGDVKVQPTPAKQEDAWRVELIEEFGNERLVYVRLGSERIRALVPNRAAITEGDTVGVSINGDDVHLFDSNGANVLCAPDGQLAIRNNDGSNTANRGHEPRVASEAR